MMPGVTFTGAIIMDDTTLQAAVRAAQDDAREGIRQGHGGPFGAAVVKGGEIVAVGHNTVLRDNDPTCHAEVNAIRAAATALGSPHLKDCVLVATSEPCPMCLTVSYWAGLEDVRYVLPRAVAARVGFDDDFIYEDLARPPAERRVRLTHEPALAKEGEAIFADWQAEGGKLY